MNGFARLFLAVSVTVTVALASQLTLAQSLSAYEFTVAHDRVFAVGDLHGDLNSFKLALEAIGLIDSDSNWIGQDSHLVILGDLIDRGPDSRQLMDFVMKLESQALQSAGQVHTLVGNHELLVTTGIVDFAHMNDFMSYNDFRFGARDRGIDGFKNAFKGESVYAKWIRGRPSLVRINDSIFVHAGLESWAKDYSILRLNEMVKSWFEYYQGVGPNPPTKTRWVTESHGPLWTRVFADYEKHQGKTLSPSELSEILRKWQAKRVVVGHSVVQNLEQALSHPFYKNQVIMLDTDIHSSSRGKLTITQLKSSGAMTLNQIDRRQPVIIDQYQAKHQQRSQQISRCETTWSSL